MKKQIIELIKNNSPEKAAEEILKLNKSDIERAKIIATKRLKAVVDSAILEYEMAEKNGRCKECLRALTPRESKEGYKICEDCSCPI